MIDAKDPLLGEGATHVAVGDQGGKVILKFPKPVEWIALDPQIAPLVAEQMIHAASACGVRVSLQVPEKQINAMQRAALAARVKLVMSNLQDRGKAPEFIATEIVDIVLTAIK